jgi:hypothetical protein
MRRLAAASLLALLSLAAPAVSHASAAPATHSGYPLVRFDAGDAHYLVYDRESSYGHTVMYVRTKHGPPRSLGSDETKGRKVLSYSLMGSTLTGGDNSEFGGKFDSQTVFWWDLAAHTTGTVRMPNIDDDWIGSVPGGFYFADIAAHGAGLYRESVPSGHVTKLPSRLSGGVVAGPTGYVGVIAKMVSFLPYNGDRAVALDIPHQYTKDQLRCDEVWQFYARCFDYGDDGEGEYDRTFMLPLNGGKAFVISTGFGPVPLKHVLVWGSKHPSFRSGSGHVTVSRTTGHVQGEAFDEAIVSNHSTFNSTKLEALSSASAPPTIVASS